MEDFLCKKGIKRKIARELLFVSQNGKCFYCNIQCHQNKTVYSNEERNCWFVLDHKIPVSKGGTDMFFNLVGACFICNERKGSKLNWNPIINLNDPF